MAEVQNQELTQEELLKKLDGLGLISEEERKRIACVLIGHSRIVTTFWGEIYCGRCGEKIGDALLSTWPEATEAVIVGHNCETCRGNYEKLTWKDKLFAPDPFAPQDTGKEE